MKSYNHVALLGHITADPELRSTTTGKSVAFFTLAVERFAGKGNEPHTDFHRIVAWQKMGEFCARTLKKGMAVFATGMLSNHSFEGKNGKQYVTEILLHDLNILTWKGRESQVSEPLAADLGLGVEMEEVDGSGSEVSATMATCA